MSAPNDYEVLNEYYLSCLAYTVILNPDNETLLQQKELIILDLRQIGTLIDATESTLSLAESLDGFFTNVYDNITDSFYLLNIDALTIHSLRYKAIQQLIISPYKKV